MKATKCPHCLKVTATCNATGAPDGRPEFTCGNCGHWWTDGNPYAASGSEDRLRNLAATDRPKS